MVDTPDHHSSTAAAAVAPEEDSSKAAEEVPEPTFQQLLRVGVTKGLPFVAFGFFDNLIMVSPAQQQLWWCHVIVSGKRRRAQAHGIDVVVVPCLPHRHSSDCYCARLA
jgi:hypothetical protein